jgi:molybdopterin converting factor small subunit
MNLHVKFYGVFRTAAKANELDLEIRNENVTVKSLISQLVSEPRFQNLKNLLLETESSDPRPNALIMVSGREINALNGLETELGEHDEIAFLPIAHGG